MNQQQLLDAVETFTNDDETLEQMQWYCDTYVLAYCGLSLEYHSERGTQAPTVEEIVDTMTHHKHTLEWIQEQDCVEDKGALCACIERTLENDFSDRLLCTLWNEVANEWGYENIYEDLEDLLELFYDARPIDIANRILFGDVKSNGVYFYVDGYGNFRSAHDLKDTPFDVGAMVDYILNNGTTYERLINNEV